LALARKTAMADVVAIMTDRLFIRVPVGEGAFGPGKARLLELIEEKGSIRAAASAMKVSYRRAWLMLKDTEKVFGAPVLETRRGGANGGGTALNRLGQGVVRHYRALESHAAMATRGDIAALDKLRH
jgi:molybdate transport system regulatory protein